MNMDELNELHAWMIEKRVLSCTADGVSLALDPSALPAILMQRPDDSKEPGWDDDEERLTPQEKLRREFDNARNPDNGRGR